MQKHCPADIVCQIHHIAIRPKDIVFRTLHTFVQIYVISQPPKRRIQMKRRRTCWIHLVDIVFRILHTVIQINVVFQLLLRKNKGDEHVGELFVVMDLVP